MIVIMVCSLMLKGPGLRDQSRPRVRIFFLDITFAQARLESVSSAVVWEADDMQTQPDKTKAVRQSKKFELKGFLVKRAC